MLIDEAGFYLREAAGTGRLRDLQHLLADWSGRVNSSNMFVIDEPDKLGKTALMEAAEKGHLECVKVLINNQATLDICCKFGYPAVMFAAACGHTEVVKLLARKGASLDCEEERGGMTAAMKAVCGGHVRCVEALASFGANLEILDHSNRSVLDWAQKELQTADPSDSDKLQELLDLLLRKGCRLHLSLSPPPESVPCVTQPPPPLPQRKNKVKFRSNDNIVTLTSESSGVLSSSSLSSLPTKASSRPDNITSVHDISQQRGGRAGASITITRSTAAHVPTVKPPEPKAPPPTYLYHDKVSSSKSTSSKAVATYSSISPPRTRISPLLLSTPPPPPPLPHTRHSSPIRIITKSTSKVIPPQTQQIVSNVSNNRNKTVTSTTQLNRNSNINNNPSSNHEATVPVVLSPVPRKTSPRLVPPPPPPASRYTRGDSLQLNALEISKTNITRNEVMKESDNKYGVQDLSYPVVEAKQKYIFNAKTSNNENKKSPVLAISKSSTVFLDTAETESTSRDAPPREDDDAPPPEDDDAPPPEDDDAPPPEDDGRSHSSLDESARRILSLELEEERLLALMQTFTLPSPTRTSAPTLKNTEEIVKVIAQQKTEDIVKVIAQQKTEDIVKVADQQKTGYTVKVSERRDGDQSDVLTTEGSQREEQYAEDSGEEDYVQRSDEHFQQSFSSNYFREEMRRGAQDNEVLEEESTPTPQLSSLRRSSLNEKKIVNPFSKRLSSIAIKAMDMRMFDVNQELNNWNTLEGKIVEREEEKKSEEFEVIDTRVSARRESKVVEGMDSKKGMKDEVDDFDLFWSGSSAAVSGRQAKSRSPSGRKYQSPPGVSFDSAIGSRGLFLSDRDRRGCEDVCDEGSDRDDLSDDKDFEVLAVDNSTSQLMIEDEYDIRDSGVSGRRSSRGSGDYHRDYDTINASAGSNSSSAGGSDSNTASRNDSGSTSIHTGDSSVGGSISGGGGGPSAKKTKTKMFFMPLSVTAAAAARSSLLKSVSPSPDPASLLLLVSSQTGTSETGTSPTSSLLVSSQTGTSEFGTSPTASLLVSSQTGTLETRSSVIDIVLGTEVNSDEVNIEDRSREEATVDSPKVAFVGRRVSKSLQSATSIFNIENDETPTSLQQITKNRSNDVTDQDTVTSRVANTVATSPVKSTGESTQQEVVLPPDNLNIVDVEERENKIDIKDILHFQGSVTDELQVQSGVQSSDLVVLEKESSHQEQRRGSILKTGSRESPNKLRSVSFSSNEVDIRLFNKDDIIGETKDVQLLNFEDPGEHLEEDEEGEEDSDQFEVPPPPPSSSSLLNSPAPERRHSPKFKPFSADPSQPKLRRKTVMNERFIYFSYDVLSTSYPEDIDITKKELYLEDNEFVRLFHLTKAEFKQLPTWKKTKMKKDLRLF